MERALLDHAAREREEYLDALEERLRIVPCAPAAPRKDWDDIAADCYTGEEDE
jgi:hypothetical protein